MTPEEVLNMLLRECFYIELDRETPTVDWSFNECFEMDKDRPEMHAVLVEYIRANREKIEEAK